MFPMLNVPNFLWPAFAGGVTQLTAPLLVRLLLELVLGLVELGRERRRIQCVYCLVLLQRR